MTNVSQIRTNTRRLSSWTRAHAFLVEWSTRTNRREIWFTMFIDISTATTRSRTSVLETIWSMNLRLWSRICAKTSVRQSWKRSKAVNWRKNVCRVSRIFCDYERGSTMINDLDLRTSSCSSRIAISERKRRRHRRHRGLGRGSVQLNEIQSVSDVDIQISDGVSE